MSESERFHPSTSANVLFIVKMLTFVGNHGPYFNSLPKKSPPSLQKQSLTPGKPVRTRRLRGNKQHNQFFFLIIFLNVMYCSHENHPGVSHVRVHHDSCCTSRVNSSRGYDLFQSDDLQATQRYDSSNSYHNERSKRRVHCFQS